MILYTISEFLFVDLLLIHFLSLLFRDYIDLYPFNDVDKIGENVPPLKKLIKTIINSIPALAVLILAILYFGEWKPFGIRLIVFAYFIFRGIIIYFTWYVPYLFGTSDRKKLIYQNKFGRTHNILPAIKNNPRPNTLHVILHILLFINFLLMLLCGYNPIMFI